MDPPDTLATVFLGALLVVLALACLCAKGDDEAEGSEALRVLAQRLGGHHDLPDGTASGVYRGVALVHRMATRGSGSSAVPWTEITCPLPRSYPITLHVERHRFGEAWLAGSPIRDVEVGDEVFDTAYRVEAAPADVVRAMLTPAIRAFFIGHTVELHTRDGRLVLAVRGWIEDPDAAAAAWDVAVALHDGVGVAHLAIDAAQPVVAVGSPFRAMLDDSAVGASQDARRSEVEVVEALREARLARVATARRTIAIAFGVVTALGFLLALV